MSSQVRRTFSCLSAAVLLFASSSLAQDHHADKTTTTTAASEPAQPTATTPDSITEGSVTAGGKAIAYKAVAGLITVGATDQQDAMLGLDGKLLPDSGVELPAKPEDRPATATLFYTAYFAKGVDAATRPVVFIYN